MIYPSSNISKRDWAIQKKEKERKTCSNACSKKDEIACVSNISRRGENNAKKSFII
jgi:hypothetical protein